MKNREGGLPDELENLKTIARKAEEEGTSAEFFPEMNEQALCKTILWSMEQAVAYNIVLYGDDGKAADFICRKVNPAFERVVGVPRERVEGTQGSTLFGEKIPYFDSFVRVAETGKKIRFKAHYPQIGKYFDMWVFSPEWGSFALLITDVTDSVLAEKEKRVDRCFLEEILDSLDVWLMTFDERWNAILWNRAAERLSGYCSEEARSPDSPIIEKLFPDPLYRQYVLGEMERTADSSVKTTGELETDVSVSGGGKRTIAWTCSRWRIGEEDEGGIIAAGKDMTPFRALEGALRESERRCSSIFRNSRMVMLVVDPEEFRIVDCNDAACSFYGYSREEMIGLSTFAVNMTPPEEMKRHFSRIRDGERSSFIFLHRLSDGSLRKVDVQASPVICGGKVLVFSVVRDLAEEEKTESTPSGR